jgi:hypothetical protein
MHMQRLILHTSLSPVLHVDTATYLNFLLFEHDSLILSPIHVTITFTASCVCRADGNYSAQGKLGAAVLGNAVSRVYQLLLYKGKQQHITSACISPSFQFVVRTTSVSYDRVPIL